MGAVKRTMHGAVPAYNTLNELSEFPPSPPDVLHVKESVRRQAARVSRRQQAIDDRPDADRNLRPDPKTVRTASELVQAMRDFRAWAGDPPFRVMAEQGGQLVSASTLYRVLKPNAELSTNCGLPPLKTVIAVIAGCAGSETDKQRFASAWRAIRMPAEHNVAERSLRAVRTVAS